MSSLNWLNLGDRKILQIGCGAVGNCMLPLYERHVTFQKGHIMVFDMKEEAIQHEITKYSNIRFFHKKIEQDNYQKIFDSLLKPGDILLDLAWYIDTLDLLKYCHARGILFVNTAVEEWLENESDFEDKRGQTLYTRQLQIREETKEWEGGPTAIITHGANPGWVSHATKIGLMDWVNKLVEDGENVEKAVQALENGNFAGVAMELGVQVIHIAERDTQISSIPKKTGEFVNTWSPMGYVEESIAPAELGWGTHETLKQGVNTYSEGPKNQVFFDSMGMNTLVRSWVPSGDIVGMVVRHEEAYSISKHLTVEKGGKAVYRPTVHYCYFSCSDSIASLYEMQANGYEKPQKERVLKDEIISGKDELGVFMLSNKYGTWWIGSILDCDTAKKMLPHQSATILQIAPSVLAAIVYAVNNPTLGLIHPDDMDPVEPMSLIKPYLGKFVSMHKDWTPKVMPSKYKHHKDWIIQKLLVK